MHDINDPNKSSHNLNDDGSINYKQVLVKDKGRPTNQKFECQFEKDYQKVLEEEKDAANMAKLEQEAKEKAEKEKKLKEAEEKEEMDANAMMEQLNSGENQPEANTTGDLKSFETCLKELNVNNDR